MNPLATPAEKSLSRFHSSMGSEEIVSDFAEKDHCSYTEQCREDPAANSDQANKPIGAAFRSESEGSKCALGIMSHVPTPCLRSPISCLLSDLTCSQLLWDGLICRLWCTKSAAACH
jgi:hypothetical protein